MREFETKAREERAWESARKVVRGTGDISRAFTICVRSLFQDGRSVEGSRFHFMSSYHLERLLRSPSVVAHLYYAARTYRPKELAELKGYTPRQLAELFSHGELAVLLMTMYMQRHIGRWLDDEDREPLIAKLQLYMDLGLPLGETIPALGAIRSLLVGAGRYLSWQILALHDPKGLKKYRLDMKLKRKAYDIREEMLMWNTSHVHIGATIFQHFGFGVQTAQGYQSAMLSPPEQPLDDEALRFRVAAQWLDALILTGDVPSESLGDEFLLADDKTDAFVQSVQSLLDDGSEFSWLAKRLTEIGPEKTPELVFTPPGSLLRRSKRKKKSGSLDDEVDETDSAQA
ncbi:MAG: hypothetical protein EBZ48_00300 [Proteobacteria bacterium]|nr:hypothetical protein [Pseudomonadota bacterium]